MVWVMGPTHPSSGWSSGRVLGSLKVGIVCRSRLFLCRRLLLCLFHLGSLLCILATRRHCCRL